MGEGSHLSAFLYPWVAPHQALGMLSTVLGADIPILQMKKLSPEEDKLMAHLLYLPKFGSRLLLLTQGWQGRVLEILRGALIVWLRLLS